MLRSHAVSKGNALSREVRKHISAVHVSGNLTSTERKMINVLLLNAFDHLTTESEFSLPVALLCEMIGWGDSNNIDHLKESLRRITTTSVEFDVLYDSAIEKRRPKWAVSTPISAATIADGICIYEYSK